MERRVADYVSPWLVRVAQTVIKAC